VTTHKAAEGGGKKTPAESAKASAQRREEQEQRKASHPTQLGSSDGARPMQVAPAQDRRLVDELHETLDAGRRDVTGVRRRLRITYAAIVVFSVALFALGMALVGFPARAFYRGDIDEVTFGGLAAAGAVLLGLLLYFRPLDRLQALVADSTYVTLVKDSFQYQVALRLLALDTDDDAAVERAAIFVGEAAQGSMDLVYTQMQARRAAGFSSSGG
jgi:hypothetical protein